MSFQFSYFSGELRIGGESVVVVKAGSSTRPVFYLGIEDMVDYHFGFKVGFKRVVANIWEYEGYILIMDTDTVLAEIIADGVLEDVVSQYGWHVEEFKYEENMFGELEAMAKVRVKGKVEADYLKDAFLEFLRQVRERIPYIEDIVGEVISKNGGELSW